MFDRDVRTIDKCIPQLYLFLRDDKIPSLTVERLKNRCIPCVYWAAAIFLVVTEYSNLFFSFAFFLDGFHFTFGYELIIRSETTSIMKIVCDSLSFV